MKILKNDIWIYLNFEAPKPIRKIYHAYETIKDFILPKYKYNWYDKIRCFFNPRQKWIKKHIEYNAWCDKVELIPKFLFGCVVHFVEEEECFKTTNWQGSSEGHAKFSHQLVKCYEYIKVMRPSLERKLDHAYDNLPKAQEYHERYAEVIRLEKAINKLDKEYMVWIVNNKDYMWT